MSSEGSVLSLSNIFGVMMGDSTILIVDDEDNIRKVIIDIFEDSGFEIFTAKNGREAIEIFQANKIDLILTDVRMPEYDRDSFA